jgi:hypothetical protein
MMGERDKLERRFWRAIENCETDELRRLLAKHGALLEENPALAASLVTWSIRIIGSVCNVRTGVEFDERLPGLLAPLLLLLDCGASIEEVSGMVDVPPLHAAVQMPSTAVADVLLARGCNPLMKDSRLGWLPSRMAHPVIHRKVRAWEKAAKASTNK